MSRHLQPGTGSEQSSVLGTHFGPPPEEGSGGAADLRELRRAQLTFGTAAAATVVGGYLLYILVSVLAPGLMDLPLAGHLTLGLGLGLAVFAALFLTAWRYQKHMRTRVDPLADALRARRGQVRTVRGER